MKGINILMPLSRKADIWANKAKFRLPDLKSRSGKAPPKGNLRPFGGFT
jgi:hypothetical protein